MIRALVIILATHLAMPTQASELTLPAGGQILSERQSPLARYGLPLGRAAGDTVPVSNFEGQVLRRTWRLTGQTSSMQVFAPLRQQLQDAGYELVFQCQSKDCGGFDFRFGIEVVPAPDMVVDIGDFLFLSATKDADLALSLLVSRSSSSTYIQVIEVAPPKADLIAVTMPAPLPAVAAPDLPAPIAEADMMMALTSAGRVVLADLEFETGSARLGSGPFESLTQLAAVLAANPDVRVSLVGHTDNIGEQAKNVILSHRRADAVRERMLEKFHFSDAQIETAGVGFMAPLTSNLTAAGRDTNRRVEAVLMAQ